MPVISMVSAGAPEVEINLPAAEYIRRNRFNRYHCTFDIYPGCSPSEEIRLYPSLVNRNTDTSQLCTVWSDAL